MTLVDINSLYPTIDPKYGKFQVADREIKENLFEKYRNRVIRKMVLQEVLDELEKEVWRVESRRIEGFTVGLCHARTIIEERMINK